MKEQVRYMTVEERELYEKLAKKYKIKGYSVPASLVSSHSIPKGLLKRKVKSKK